MSGVEKLEKLLNYRFKNPKLCERALTHKSFATDDNERLEFLGDAVLGLLVSDLIYQRFPDFTEGQLSMVKSHLVSKKFLHRLANHLHLEKHIRFNRENPKKSQAVLANTMEAVIGAIFLDSNYDTTKSCIGPLFLEHLDDINPTAVKNPKNTLQEFTQQKSIELPTYTTIKVTGPPHSQVFEVSCSIDSLKLQTTASSMTKKDAEQLAATAMLKKIEESRS